MNELAQAFDGNKLFEYGKKMPPRVNPSNRPPQNITTMIDGVRPFREVSYDGHINPKAQKDYERRHKMFKGLIDEFYIRGDGKPEPTENF